MPASGGLIFDQVLFDARRSHALAFAEKARQLGARTRAISGDVADAGLLDLAAHRNAVQSRARRTAVAGMTDFRSLFLLQAIAADAGLHPVLRIHHPVLGKITGHEAFGAPLYRFMSEVRLKECGEYWAPQAARLVLGLPAPAAYTPPQAGNLGEANLRSLGSRALVTWVMA
jgi:hypothetical protein